MKTVFYSWQSDIGSKTNRNIIKDAIQKAVNKQNATKADQTCQYELVEATTNESGSPDIVEVILKKINNCELFVGDITPIALSKKEMPNSNVLFESGKKGFERTIFILNEAYASVENLPFDIKTKRITKYRLSEDDVKDTEKKSKSIKELTSAIFNSLELIEDLPPIVLESSDDATQKTKKERDIIKLKRLLNKMPIKVIQDHVNQGIESLVMNLDTLTVLYNVQAIYRFMGFKLYDKELDNKIDKFVKNFSESLDFGENFHHLRNTTYKFESSDSISQENYIFVLNKLNNSLESLLDYIHNKYVEIDLEEYNTIAWQNYLIEKEN